MITCPSCDAVRVPAGWSEILGCEVFRCACGKFPPPRVVSTLEPPGKRGRQRTTRSCACGERYTTWQDQPTDACTNCRKGERYRASQRDRQRKTRDRYLAKGLTTKGKPRQHWKRKAA